MEVIFYYNTSDARSINKTLLEGVILNGTLRDSSSIMSPIIMFDSQEVLRYNYCYIPDFRRYYSVQNIDSVRNKLYNVSFTSDVLMSFRTDILMLPVVVDKQSGRDIGDEYIDDSSLVTDNVMFQTVYNYPNGFNDNSEIILITAG